MRILEAALIVLAGGALSGCPGEPQAPPPPPPPPAAPVPAPPEPPRPAPGPYDPASATATLLFQATAKGALPVMRLLKTDACAECANSPRAGTLRRETVVAKDGRLANVVAWVSKGTERWTFPKPKEEALLEMKDCIYVPHVLSLGVGQPLRVSNPDHRMLHFHAFGEWVEAQREVPRGKSFVQEFPGAEVGLRMKCDVHGWMDAWACVFPHPFHGVTDHEGVTAIRLPPGTYEISVWHEYDKFTKPAPRTVTLAAGESKEIEFVFEVK